MDAFLFEAPPNSISDLASFASHLLESIGAARDAITVRSRCEAAKELGLTETLLTLVKTRQPGQRVRRLLEMALARRWAGEAMASDPCFQLEGPSRVRLIERLRESEGQAALAAQAATLNAAAPYRPGNMDVAPRGTELWVLKSQINARRRRPLRWLFSHAPNVILQAKPCIVASPLAVAQFLHADPYEFDVVIFDEASQIPTADAVVPISRARQIVVVGDTQQMPPSSFFDREAPQEDDPEEEVYDSILGECETLLPSRSLLWHYRSHDERLIAFSNHNFYKGELLTFPSAWQERPDMGVKFHYLSSAVYGRSGSRANPEEAQRVVEILKEELEANPEHEVGVTAMSVAQSVEIRARIEAEAQDNSLLQQWLDEGGRARNLETIQGDEFDVSILSFGYGKDAAGNLQLNFGPLSRDHGYKRLNVATTRARKKTIVVASLCASDIPANRVGPGGQLVRQYLDYAERGPIALAGAVRAGGVDVYESPFEEEVARELRALDWLVDTQVGVGKFRVAIGVKHPNHPGRYLAGVECDGATYHSAETTRDRDIGRQEVLKRLGWNIYRIWSPDWFRDRRRVLADLQSYLYELLADDGSQDSDSTYNDGRRGWQTPLRRNHPLVFRPLEQGMRPGTIPYEVEGPTSFPVGYDSSQWKQWLVEKIRVEGPWEENELIGMISLHSGPTLYQLRSFVRAAVSEGKLVAKEGRLWHPETDPRLVLVKVNSGAARVNSPHWRLDYWASREPRKQLESVWNL